MTEKAKAKELVGRMWGGKINFNNKFNEQNYCGADDAIDCALICVTESIEELKICEIFYENNSYYGLRINFLNKVKEEINKLKL